MILVRKSLLAEDAKLLGLGDWDTYPTDSVKEVFDTLGIELTSTERYSFLKHLQREPHADVLRGSTVYSFTYQGEFPSFEGV